MTIPQLSRLACAMLICIAVIGVAGRVLGVDPLIRDILLAVALAGVILRWARDDA